MRLNLFFLFLVITVMLMGCTSKDKVDNSLEEIKKKGEFVVGLDDSFPPMGFKDENGEIVGFDIDLAKEVAKRMGVNVKFKAVDWDGVLLSLKNKNIDVIWNGLTITEKRKKEIAFSKVYLENRQIIVVNNNSSIKRKEDIIGKIVGVQLGSSSENALNSSEISKELKEIKKYSNNTEALMDLKAGRIDAVILDEIVGRYYMEKKPGVYRILEDDFGKESYGVGIRKEDVKLKDELNKILDEMKKDGTAKNISEKWFGEDIVTR
ncbi:amino acid ABC transporter substrate-binding protein [Tepidibacter thalassicus]|uniref:Amino acid ABC transporter substrate-binding protein, PAAT family (TC 3.A.1.3.-) n=1 Tax=Tepidibacter thalassicus DSM 15285 TaxID=1123350 RepID=A0A1M5PH59_9FIRM|nr:amino acid ABC transporter substrate-binding protein [Tepidibacter thalassicus]SHH01105.1 amino acid ABC transporter substrate-binding protein, PAAT family (TC 3.A.1.3.-) [Tepidibacter thalassicus DSM 15285]